MPRSDAGCWRPGKDYDPDRERSEAKRLARQLQKERRGAMRELRKDAAFLGEVCGARSPHLARPPALRRALTITAGPPQSPAGC